MRTKKYSFAALFLLASIFSYGLIELHSRVIDEEVAAVFTKNCSTAGCHSGEFPPMGLNLEKDRFISSLVNVPSSEDPEFLLVDVENPNESYLIMKILGQKGIKGKPMPPNADSLGEDEINIVRIWMEGLKSYPDAVNSGRDETKKRNISSTPDFWGTHIVNLPTTRGIDRGRFLFRISHRYFPAVKEGYEAFYGLDGPAAILFSLGFGLSDNLSVTLGRSNRLKEFEFSGKWVFLENNISQGFPVSAALRMGLNWITQSIPGKKTFRKENMRTSAQLSLSYRISDSLSLLVVPGYTSNTDPLENSLRESFSFGIGGRFMFLQDTSFLVELIPVISGYRSESTGWGIGLEKKVGGHVFQLYILNTYGLTTGQYIPGGDLVLNEGEFRLGFSIFRLF